MRLTQPLYLPPKFHFWKDFGAGRKRRIPYYKYWWNIWRKQIMRDPVRNRVTAPNRLPAGARIMNGEDFLQGHIDMMPDDIIKMKENQILYDHPWPHNINLDPERDQELVYCYNIHDRFYKPRVDAAVLTNTLIGDAPLEANPEVEPSDSQVSLVERQYNWATKADSVLTKLPRKRQWPRIDQRPTAKFGIRKDRQEINVLNSMLDVAQNILAQHYHVQNDQEKLDRLIARRSIAFPFCQVPFMRQDGKINFNLCIDSLSVTNLTPLPLINETPDSTRATKQVSIEPRSWRSILEKSRSYSPNWSFSLPRDVHLHTIQLASRIRRDHREDLGEEMLARLVVHAFGLTSQFARFKALERRIGPDDGRTVILDDPLGMKTGDNDDDDDDDNCQATTRDDEEILAEPIVLQTVGFELPTQSFHFMRYQLNSLKFNDSDETRIKNQAWYSGPVKDLRQALRFYVDFQSVP